MFECKLCNSHFKYKKGLSKHLAYTHKIDLKVYYDEFLKVDNEEKCLICNEYTRFRNFGNGYAKLCKTCLHKSKFPVNNEYWIYKGYSQDEAVLLVKQFQSNSSKRVKNRGISLKTEYWVKKGFSENEAKQKLKERQSTFSLEKCIQKYGENNGIKRWKERQEKWINTLNNKPELEKIQINIKKGITLDNMINKWGKIEGIRRYNEWLDKIHFNLSNRTQSYSTISQELFNNLLPYTIKEQTNFATNNKEFFIKSNEKIYFYDFKFKDKIIEFNGDLWHANPSKYSSLDKPNPHHDLTAGEIWEYDSKKVKIAIDKGYKVKVIWESDFKKDKNLVLKQCIDFLNE